MRRAGTALAVAQQAEMFCPAAQCSAETSPQTYTLITCVQVESLEVTGVQSSPMRGTKPGADKEVKAAGPSHFNCAPGHVHDHSANASGTNAREGKPFKVKDITSTNPGAGYKSPSHQKPGQGGRALALGRRQAGGAGLGTCCQLGQPKFHHPAPSFQPLLLIQVFYRTLALYLGVNLIPQSCCNNMQYY